MGKSTKFPLYVVVVFVIAFLLQVELSYGFAMTGLTGLLLMVGALIAISAIVIGFVRSKTHLLWKGVAFFPAVVLGVFVGYAINEKKMHESERHVSLILSYIEDWRLKIRPRYVRLEP